MILEEISFKTNAKSKKEAILENIGRQVILCDDSYDHWIHGLLLEKKENLFGDDYYLIHIADGRGETVLRYDDLQKLFLLKAHRGNLLPKIE